MKLPWRLKEWEASGRLSEVGERETWHDERTCGLLWQMFSRLVIYHGERATPTAAPAKPMQLYIDKDDFSWKKRIAFYIVYSSIYLRHNFIHCILRPSGSVCSLLLVTFSLWVIWEKLFIILTPLWNKCLQLFYFSFRRRKNCWSVQFCGLLFIEWALKEHTNITPDQLHITRRQVVLFSLYSKSY